MTNMCVGGCATGFASVCVHRALTKPVAVLSRVEASTAAVARHAFVQDAPAAGLLAGRAIMRSEYPRPFVQSVL
jgi:hypothetical protein